MSACGFKTNHTINEASHAGFEQDTLAYHINQQYIELSGEEAAEYDFNDATRFAEKAKKGEFNPDALGGNLGLNKLQLAAARGMLLEAYNSGIGDVNPKALAKASRYYDCWHHEINEGNAQDKNHALLCKFKFKAVAGQLKAPIVEIATVITAPLPKDLNVYFAHNSSKVSYSTKQQIEDFANTLKSRGIGEVKLHAFTDRSGSENYNKSLAKTRADAVSAILLSANNSLLIDMMVNGENNIPNPTEDGVKDSTNRLVIIDIAQ